MSIDVWLNFIVISGLSFKSEPNESPNHLAKNSRKKHVRKCQQRLQIFSRVLISYDKNFILLSTCFGLIFTKLFTLLSLRFFCRYIALFSS